MLKDNRVKSIKVLATAMMHTAVLNILTGVTVAGIDAGKVFNTWPWMGSGFVPGDLWRKE